MTETTSSSDQTISDFCLGVSSKEKAVIVPIRDKYGRVVAFARRINPGIQILHVSAQTGEGMEAWLAWIEAGRRLAMTVRKTAAS